MWVEFVAAILKAVLPWLFSGSTTTTTTRAPGLPSLDRSGARLSLKQLPKLVLPLALLWALGGCAFGGAREEITIVMCEPGSVVEIATDNPIAVLAPGQTQPGKRNMAGAVAMPKSVYRLLREAWVAQHPDDSLDAAPSGGKD